MRRTVLISVISDVLLLGILAFAAWQDIKHRSVPLYLMIAGAVTGSALSVAGGSFPEFLLGLIPGAVCWACAFLSKEAIGFGDAGMITVTGLFLGLSGNAVLVTGALLIACLAAIICMVIKKKKRKDELPFIPFMLCAYIIMLAVDL